MDILKQWLELEAQCRICERCELSKEKRNTVWGRGNILAPILFVGEGPGEQEDIKGDPFVGPAGKLLDTLLLAHGFCEEDYYIANIVKCRPPGNRTPSDEEAEACLPYLRSQVSIIKPSIIVCLGNTAAKYIIGKEIRISQTRGLWLERKNYHIIATFHPAALLRDEAKKLPMWHDFKKVKLRLDEIQKQKA